MDKLQWLIYRFQNKLLRNFFVFFTQEQDTISLSQENISSDWAVVTLVSKLSNHPLYGTANDVSTT